MTRPSATPVVCLCACFTSWSYDSNACNSGFSVRFSICLGAMVTQIACILGKEILVCQLHCGQLLPFGPLPLEGSRVWWGVPSLLCATGASGLLLQVVPPIVELSLQSLLLRSVTERSAL
jgi:hypothetical protein